MTEPSAGSMRAAKRLDDECFHDGWAIDHPETLKQIAEFIDQETVLPDLIEALESAAQFIRNGIEFGYITEPDPIDSASKTLPLIVRALAKAKGES